jgi:solute carrier family 13 (sodium-dependent dicarboxylate transporter), member 2/3/5
VSLDASAEPSVRNVSSRRRLILFALAVAVGLACAALAPPDWDGGPGRVTLTFRGEQVIDAPITIGLNRSIGLLGTADATLIEVDFPRGIPLDDPINATITVTRDGENLRADSADLTLRIELPDGREEIVPITRWDDIEEHFEALRRASRGSAVALGILGLVVVLWVTEAVPLFVTSLIIPVILVFSGVAGATEATAPFFNPIIVLFFAGFLMAEAMRRADLHRSVAIWITATAGRSAVTLYATMLGVTAFLSMWMSNTAATAVLIPIALAVTAPLRRPGFRRALVLGIAFAAAIGGIGSAIGTPANLLAIQMLEEFGGRSISFLGWFAFGLPVVLILLPIMAVYLWKHSAVEVDPARFREARRIAQEERRQLGRLRGDQIFILVVFGAVAMGWMTETIHGIDAGMIALAGAALLFMTDRLLPEDLGNVSWPALLTFGGGLTLGLFLVETGTSDYLAVRLSGLASLPGMLAMLIVAAVTLALTTVASNTASAAIVIPLAIPLAGVLGIDPTLLVVVVTVTSSLAFALVIGTPPAMIAYSTGLYTSGQVFRVGIVLEIVGLAVLIGVITWIWGFLGVV